jgi:hypothetical protein
VTDVIVFAPARASTVTSYFVPFVRPLITWPVTAFGNGPAAAGERLILKLVGVVAGGFTSPNRTVIVLSPGIAVAWRNDSGVAVAFTWLSSAGVAALSNAATVTSYGVPFWRLVSAACSGCVASTCGVCDAGTLETTKWWRLVSVPMTAKTTSILRSPAVS